MVEYYFIDYSKYTQKLKCLYLKPKFIFTTKYNTTFSLTMTSSYGIKKNQYINII